MRKWLLGTVFALSLAGCTTNHLQTADQQLTTALTGEPDDDPSRAAWPGAVEGDARGPLGASGAAGSKVNSRAAVQ